ncbi:hypothetical protein ID866_9397 [Astraeus odoratus]|nr:hypothetical protein ID866_9397 [Astraeus odoratus]
MEGERTHRDDEADPLQAQCLAHRCADVVCRADKHALEGVTRPHGELEHWCGGAQSSLGGGVCGSRTKEGWRKWVGKGGDTVGHASMMALCWDWMDAGTGWWSRLKKLCDIGRDNAVGGSCQHLNRLGDPRFEYALSLKHRGGSSRDKGEGLMIHFQPYHAREYHIPLATHHLLRPSGLGSLSVIGQPSTGALARAPSNALNIIAANIFC